MSRSRDTLGAMRVLVRELREEPPPQVDWARVEERLWARIDGGARPRWVALPRPHGLSHAFGLAAAAAVILLGAQSFIRDGSAPARSLTVDPVVDVKRLPVVSSAAHTERDASTLPIGAVVEATTERVWFTEAGVATWTLEPGSRAKLVARAGVGTGETIRLERGAIRAWVVPVQTGSGQGLVESFAVEVENTRVAVHGTVFSVRREGSRAIVAVREGAVAVGPAGSRGTTTGHLLVAPVLGSFSLDGGKTAQLLQAPISGVDGSLPSVAEEPGERLAVAPTVSAMPMPAEPASGPVDPGDVGLPHQEGPAPALRVIARSASPRHTAEPEPMAPQTTATPSTPVEPPPITVEVVRARLAGCFVRSYEADASSVRVSVASTLRIDVNPDGSLRAARFDPPLKPEFQACAGAAIAGRFAGSQAHIDIPVQFGP